MKALAGFVVALAWAVPLVVLDTGGDVALAQDDSPTSISAADRDLVVRVRQAGLWEQPAGIAAQQRGHDERVRQVGANIGNEHHELDRIDRQVADELGIELPDEPTAEQQGWLDELAISTGEEFDRVFVDRLRATHGKIFPAIASIRAGTRNDRIREFAGIADAYVARHLSYLESTGLVNFATLPAPSAYATDPSDAVWTVTAEGALGPADRELLERLREAALWEQVAATDAQQRGASPTVREIGGEIANEYRELDGLIGSVSTQLGVALPDQPEAAQRGWLEELTAANGDQFDRTFVARLRAAEGELLQTIAEVRAGTRNELIRALTVGANDAVLRNLGYLESTGLVDYNSLPRPSPPAGVHETGLDRDGGLPPAVIWLVLATAAVAGMVALGRLVMSR